MGGALLVLSGALALGVGCGDEGVQTADGGIAPPSGRDALVVPDVFVPQTPQETCDATDLMAQRLCGLGRKCAVVGEAYKCAAAGDVAAFSPCNMDQDTGLDDCVGGSVCADPTSSGQNLCLPYCSGRWTACGDGVCAGEVSSDLTSRGIFACLPASGCDPTAPSGSCPPGQVCIWDPRFGAVTVCVPQGWTGSGQEGDACDPDGGGWPCGEGLTCVGVVPGQETCTVVCRLATGTGCGTDGHCVYIGDETYGYCAKGSESQNQSE